MFINNWIGWKKLKNLDDMKEEKIKLGQIGAFPQKNIEISEEHKGMSKRFYAACAAMQGVLSNPYTMGMYHKDTSSDKTLIITRGCFAWADELLKQENK